MPVFKAPFNEQIGLVLNRLSECLRILAVFLELLHKVGFFLFLELECMFLGLTQLSYQFALVLGQLVNWGATGNVYQ